ncbi:VOC family protein [Haladaptatus sp. NG-WS-4]
MNEDADHPATARIGRVSLRVNDLDEMVGFYRDVVGLTVQRRRAERATLGVGNEPLLELVARPDAAERRPDESGLFHVAFNVPSRVALGDTLSRVREQWRLDGASDHLVSEALYFSDPEGNGIEVYRDRPSVAWPRADDGTIRMETLPLDLDAIRKGDRSSPNLPEGTTVGHVHLEVSSLSESETFYVEILGMDVRQRYGESALFVADGDYHHHVGLNVWNGRTAPPTGRGLRWFELVVPDRKRLDAIRRRFDELNRSISTLDGGVSVTDPNGIELHIRVSQ